MTLRFECDAKDCTRHAQWAYIGEGGDIYLCDAHYNGGRSSDFKPIPRPPSDHPLDRALRRDHSICGVEPCSDCR